ncbi:DUF447 family protein [Methylocapsa sp. D3K7]|nr:DUF447 domain-containing protein [Methylocapsa sp. D3K7]WGJ13371.1 DUF447 family protein [Methylocapsa sp. D3K7]
MPMIREVIVTTVDRSGQAHMAPLGLIEDGEGWIIAPFLPSATHDNLLESSVAVANYTDDARIFAGLITGRRDWPLVPATKISVPRLADALAHAELKVAHFKADAERPRFHCKILHKEQHAPFEGVNRAANAVVECAILLTRLHMLPRDKIDLEIAYLAIAVEKTAGPREKEAWSWLMQKREAYYAGN